MTRNRAWPTARTVVCLVAGVFFLTFSGGAMARAVPTAGNGLGFAYDAAQEITLVGTVQGFVSKSVVGSPAGVHLLISSAGKMCDVHLGPYVSSENERALYSGQLVQVIGVNENVHGKNVLLARQLIFQGRLVIVRNERGLLVHNLAFRPRDNKRKFTTNGGIQ